jgi:hypothetical protein
LRESIKIGTIFLILSEGMNREGRQQDGQDQARDDCRSPHFHQRFSHIFFLLFGDLGHKDFLFGSDG